MSLAGLIVGLKNVKPNQRTYFSTVLTIPYSIILWFLNLKLLKYFCELDFNLFLKASEHIYTMLSSALKGEKIFTGYVIGQVSQSYEINFVLKKT